MFFRIRIRILFSIFILLSLQGQGQYAPGIRNFTPKDYGRNQPPENYCILQDQQGLIYAGNAGGILRYSGSTWNFIPVRTGVHVTCLTIDEMGVIYAGTFNDFGYLSPDASGQLSYRSLLPLLEDSEHQPGLILRCFAVNDGVYFQSENGIYFYSGGKLKIIYPDSSSFHLSFSCGNEFYVRERGAGLVKFSDGKRKLISSDTLFTTYGIFGLISLNNTSALVITKEAGLWKLDLQTGKPVPFPVENSNEIIPFFGGIRLDENTFALNTFDRGIILLDESGEIISVIDDRSGLPIDEIIQVIRDRQGNLWCVSSSGISFIEYNSPFEYFNGRHGLEGSVESIVVRGNRIYAGTSSGFFVSSEETNTFFNKVPQVKGHVFEVLDLEEEKSMVISSGEGLYILREGQNIQNVSEGIYNAAAYISTRRILIATGAHGADVFAFPSLERITTLDFRQGRILKVVVAGAGTDSHLVIWAGTLAGGVVRIKIDPGGVIGLDLFDDIDGLISGYVRPFILEDEKAIPVFATTSGFQQFIPEEEIRKSLHDSLKGRPEFERGFFDTYQVFDSTWHLPVSSVIKHNDSWWICVNDKIMNVRNGERSNTNWFLNFDFGRINNLYQERENSKLYICSAEGLISFGDKKTPGRENRFSAYIELVQSKSRKVLFSGTYGDSTGLIASQPESRIPELPYSENSVEFQFAYPYFETFPDIYFSYLLEGHDDKWSDWKKTAHATYTNLYEGSYSFRVKAKAGNGTESEPVSFSFVIRAPWYRTGWAYFFYFIAGLILIMIIMRISSHQLKQKNIRLEKIVKERTAEIEEKNTELVYQQKEITDSITYAKRIQEAILPVRNKINTAFPESFILYKPKDIVSGDFFWFHSDKNKSIIICADCTGHGVPGAFMSMICTDKLNHIILEQKIIQPSRILSELNRGIKKSLKQEDEENLQTKDGMDGAICLFDHATGRLWYSGANRPLWLLRNSGWVEYRATKSAIGGFTPEEKEFEEVMIQIEPGDQIYLSTDGYADQFGGEKGKKMMVKNFRSKILEIHHLPLSEQERLLDQHFEFWKNHTDENGDPFEQVDDVCVIGVRF